MLKHAKEQRLRHVLCYLDLDQFKVVNDTCGHSAGGELLRQLSALLRTRMRERDTLARLEGDEFAVLLGECPLDQGVRIANQLRELVQDLPFIWEGRRLRDGGSNPSWGHLMGIKTIAESVESQAISDKLKVIGVDYVQGYAIAKPRPFLEMIEAL
jgi:GGDEF domain-containing protein